MLRIFIGYDPRQPIALQVLAHSIMRRSSVPVSITPLVLSTLPIKRRGLTEFTYSRYMVPWLCSYVGNALFLDADMLCIDDVSQLFMKQQGEQTPISVVKNRLRFEWPSMIYFNNWHSDCKKLTPDFIDDENNKPMTFSWATEIGEIESAWNHCVGYDQPRTDARLVHFTAGIPCWPETKGCEYSRQWHKEARSANSSVTWQELMGGSVHVNRVKQGMNT